MTRKRVFGFLVTFCLLSGMMRSSVYASNPLQTDAEAPQLVHAMNGWATGETMDPAIDYETTGMQFLAQVYDTLIAPPRNPGEDYIPGLAVSWDISTDGKTYTFTIRRNVHFSNGAMLTPEDVAYTFRRGLLNGGSSSPQWLLFEPLLGSTGYNDISDLVDSSGDLLDDRESLKLAASSKLLAACRKVEQAVEFSAENGTVTFHLAQAWGPFLETLVGSWGSILDKEWVTAQGGWDGRCSTWQNYYATDASNSPIGNAVNGTGPYRLTSVDAQGNARLDSKPDYWRNVPMWAGGPSGEAYFKSVLMQNVANATERKNMLLNDQAQLASITGVDQAELNDQVLFDYPITAKEGVLVNPNGMLKRYHDPSTSTTDGFFNYRIKTGGARNYIGSGHLGDGIPVNFFEDIHVRKAFSYAFDWGAWIGEGFDGQALQRRGVIPNGFSGYSDSQPVFSKDLDKAAQEFGLAWDGNLASQGFTLTIAYNVDNLARQKACEILKENIESINPTKYHVNVLALPWADYLTDYRAGYLPFYITSWVADIHHPHNFAAAYLKQNGSYGARQSLPNSLASIFEPKVLECVQASQTQMQSCYEELQSLSYQYAVDLWGAQPINQTYTRAELQGFYTQPMGAIYYYSLSEAPLPVLAQVSQGNAVEVSFSDPRGGLGKVNIPENTFNDDTQIVITPGKVVGDMSSGFHFGALSFDISAYGEDGSKLNPSFDPGSPVQVVIHYGEPNLSGINESSVRLRYWNGETWENAGCGEQVVDTNANTLTVPLCHFSDYALAGYPLRYFPLIARN